MATYLHTFHRRVSTVGSTKNAPRYSVKPGDTIEAPMTEFDHLPDSYVTRERVEGDTQDTDNESEASG